MQPKILGNPPKTNKWWGRRLQHVIMKLLRRIISLDDTPYRIAMGSACGIFSSALPVFGQTFISIVLARLFSVSVIASIPWSWISNPLTTLPIWYGGYKLGLYLLPDQGKALSYAEIAAILQNFDRLTWSEGLLLMSTTVWDAMQPLWLGTSLLGITMAIPGYLLVYYFVDWRQRRRALQRQHWKAVMNSEDHD
ncbi:MAG: DUF2062 domain-containing protein [Methylobacter sp.]|nr:DUF2062 domain-containing protein [Methylobacter sp.]